MMEREIHIFRGSFTGLLDTLYGIGYTTYLISLINKQRTLIAFNPKYGKALGARAKDQKALDDHTIKTDWTGVFSESIRYRTPDSDPRIKYIDPKI